MTPIPAFYYRRTLEDHGAVLEEGDGFVINRRNGVVAIDCQEPWKPEFEEAYRHHEVGGVSSILFRSPPGKDVRSTSSSIFPAYDTFL